MQEIEVKILDIDEKIIEKKLASFAVIKSKDVLLKTITFNNPHTKASVRLRVIENKVIFTVKVPIPHEKYKIREEHETYINDLNTFKLQLNALGLRQVQYHEKRRTTYLYKDSEIVIDKYPNIPPYLEIEGPKPQITDIIEKLGYTFSQTTNQSIYNILSGYNADNRDIRF